MANLSRRGFIASHGVVPVQESFLIPQDFLHGPVKVNFRVSNRKMRNSFSCQSRGLFSGCHSSGGCWCALQMAPRRAALLQGSWRVLQHQGSKPEESLLASYMEWQSKIGKEDSDLTDCCKLETIPSHFEMCSCVICRSVVLTSRPALDCCRVWLTFLFWISDASTDSERCCPACIGTLRYPFFLWLLMVWNMGLLPPPAETFQCLRALVVMKCFLMLSLCFPLLGAIPPPVVQCPQIRAGTCEGSRQCWHTVSCSGLGAVCQVCSGSVWNVPDRACPGLQLSKVSQQCMYNGTVKRIPQSPSSFLRPCSPSVGSAAYTGA